MNLTELTLIDSQTVEKTEIQDKIQDKIYRWKMNRKEKIKRKKSAKTPNFCYDFLAFEISKHCGACLQQN